MDLFNESKKFKETADKILTDSQLLNTISQFGDVNFVGSFKYDLMLSGDIDIHIYVEPKQEKALELFNKLIKQYYFQAYKFDDYVKWQDSRFPKGYYIGLGITPDGYDKRWKIDIWMTSEDTIEGKKNNQRLGNISEEQRLSILAFKQYRKEEKLDLPSVVIYDAVLDNNISNLDQFVDYLKNHER